MWSGNTQALIFRAVLWPVSAHQGRRKDTKDQAPSMVEKIGSTLILGVTRFGVAIHIDTGCHTSECHICHITQRFFFADFPETWHVKKMTPGSGQTL